jgi:DNA-binding PadR family transcriptional regulator
MVMERHSPGEFEQIVLLAVLQLQDDAWPVAIREEIQRRTGRGVARGALYTGLERLEAKGLLGSRTGPRLADRAGRPRRYFEVTAQGLEELRQAQRALQRMRDGLESLLDER